MSRPPSAPLERARFPEPASWDRPGLEDIGFRGFLPLVGIATRHLPTGHGVYVVLRPNVGMPHELLPDNPVMRPRLVHYSVADLERRWISGTPVVYIGKAMGARGICDRLRPFSRKSSSHTGGRAIWQLKEAITLLVAWVETPNHVASDVESDLIAAFKERYGRGPFANVSQA